MSNMKVFFLLLVATGGYSKLMLSDPPSDDDDHYYLEGLDEDSIKNIWFETTPDSHEEEETGRENKENDMNKEIDKDIFMHHKPPPYVPHPAHYKPPLIYHKPETSHHDSEYNNNNNNNKKHDKSSGSKKPLHVKWPHKNLLISKDKIEEEHDDDYIVSDLTDDIPKTLLKFPTKPPVKIKLKDIDQVPVVINEVKGVENMDTLVLVLKVPKKSNLYKKNKILLPALTLDINKNKVAEAPKAIFTHKFRTPEKRKSDRKENHPTALIPGLSIPPYLTQVRPPLRDISLILNKLDELKPKPVIIPVSIVQKPEHKEKQVKNVWPEHHHKPYHHYNKPEYLNIGEKPTLLWDEPVHDLSGHNGYIDLNAYGDGQWIRLRRNTDEKTVNDKSETNQSNDDQNKQITNSKYQGELPPLEFPNFNRKHKGSSKQYVPKTDDITDAPLYFPETDDKILHLIYHKDKSATTATTTTTPTTKAPDNTEFMLKDDDETENFETDAPLLFPKHVKLVIKQDEYKQYIPPTYFPENEAELDYKYEIRPFKKGSIFDRDTKRNNLNDDSSILSTESEPATATTTTTNYPDTTEKTETLTTHEGYKLKKMLTEDENIIDTNDTLKHFNEPKPPLVFPETEEELIKFNIIYNRDRIGERRNIPIYTKRKHHKNSNNSL